MRYLINALLMFMLSYSLSAYSWNAYGHKVVATIAYQKLKPEVRHQVDFLVSEFKQQYTEMDSFAQVACWPDMIRSQKIETYTRWHYIDVAISTDNSSLKNLVDTDNAVWAVAKIEPVVKNTHANSYERARFLSFLAHIVGDLHQPLHTVSDITTAMPNGDRGGNDYRIIVGKEHTNLHKLWDGGLGVFAGDSSSEQVTAKANALMAQYPDDFFGKKLSDLTPDDWVQEGVLNAKQYAYSTEQNQPVSVDYIEAGRRVAEQEVTLAGYRLARLLNQYFS